MIDLPRGEVERLCRRFGVARLALFGSAVTDDFDPDRSDLEVLVEFTPGASDLFDAYFGLREALEDLAGRPVDLVMTSAVKNPYVARSIAETRRELYAAGRQACICDAGAAIGRVRSFVLDNTWEHYEADVLLRSAGERQQLRVRDGSRGPGCCRHRNRRHGRRVALDRLECRTEAPRLVPRNDARQRCGVAGARTGLGVPSDAHGAELPSGVSVGGP